MSDFDPAPTATQPVSESGLLIGGAEPEMVMLHVKPLKLRAMCDIARKENERIGHFETADFWARMVEQIDNGGLRHDG